MMSPRHCFNGSQQPSAMTPSSATPAFLMLGSADAIPCAANANAGCTKCFDGMLMAMLSTTVCTKRSMSVSSS